MDGGELGAGAHGEAVAAFGVEVAFHGALGGLVLGDLVKDGTDVAGVVVGDDEEGGGASSAMGPEGMPSGPG